MSQLWTPPRHVYRLGDDSADEHGQMRIPGIGVDHPKVPKHQYVHEGDSLYKQYGNPHVWGSVAGHHNPFQWHPMGHSLENADEVPASVHEWEAHDHEGFDEASKHLQRLTDKSHPVIRASTDVLHKVLDDGRFKSQFETHSSNGMLSHSTRAGVENKHFGYPDHLRTWDHHYDRGEGYDEEGDEDNRDEEHPKHARPIYGILDHEPQIRGDSAEQYGEHKVVLHKPSIWHRTSVTFGDSLNHHDTIGPSPVQKVSPYSFHGSVNDEEHDPHGYPDPEGPMPHQRIKALKHFGTSRTGGFYDPESGKPPEGMGYNYAEAQFHGGVKTSDIHYVSLAEGRQSDDLKKRLDHHGVPWVESGRSGYPYGHSGGTLKEALFQRVALAVESYQRFLGRSVMGQVRVIAQQGSDRFLLSEASDPSGTARVADTTHGTISGEFPIQSFLGRGYWEDPEPGVNAQAILAIVKPTA